MSDRYITINPEKKQKVYIDVSIMEQLLFFTGIQRVVKEIVLQLYKYDDIELVFLDYNEKKRAYKRVSNVKFMNSLRKGEYSSGKESDNRKIIFPSEIEAGSIFFELDATWICRLKRSYLYPLLKKNDVKIIVHFYDLICITHPQFFEDRLINKFMDYAGAAIQYADKIICNAEATRRDIMDVAEAMGVMPPNNIEVVPLGANFTEYAIDDRSISDEIRGAVEGNKYILMVGTIEPRKNHKLILDAYDKGLKNLGYNIILAGNPGWKNEDFMNRLIGHPDFGKRIFLFEKQPDYIIDYLYKNARFVAFLSYKEGFGLPIIEALAKGVPVIATDTAINKEIGGDKCIFFSQDDAEGLCRRIQQIDDDSYNTIKDNLNGFTYCTWDLAGQKMKNAIT